MNSELQPRMEMLTTLSSAVCEAYEQGSDPKQLLCELLHKDPSEADSFTGVAPERLWNLLFQLASETDSRRFSSRHREPIRELNSVFDLINNAKKIVVLMGAGASSGPDFRSPGGLYDSIAQSGALADPYDVFDLDVYSRNPEIFWNFAHLIFPSETPIYSAAHLFIEELERHMKLHRVYTQNVDTLEKGIPDERLRCVHGSWRENKCLNCGHLYSLEDIRPAVNARTCPHCVVCGGTVKPGIVFFGQPTNLNENEAYRDANDADLLIVIGTSLKVAPISELPAVMRNVPSILINREPVNCTFNAELIGECTDIIDAIQAALGWQNNVVGALPQQQQQQQQNPQPEQVPHQEPVPHLEPVPQQQLEQQPPEQQQQQLQELQQKPQLLLQSQPKQLQQPTFYEPNKFIFHSDSSYATSVVETGRNMFLVTPRRMSQRDYD